MSSGSDVVLESGHPDPSLGGATGDTAPSTPAGSLQRPATVQVQPSPIPNATWRRGWQLGTGRVHKAMYTGGIGQVFAVKAYDIHQAEDGNGMWAKRVAAELERLQSLRHRHIVTYLGHDLWGYHLHLHMEYVSGESLQANLATFGVFAVPILRVATRGIVEGLHYLHTRDPPVVHGNLKGSNILVTQDFCVKLADYGCCEFDAGRTAAPSLGSIAWAAPEVVQQRPGDGRAADVWGVGCTVIEMAGAERPWGNDATLDEVMSLLSGTADREGAAVGPPIPAALPADGRDLTKMCLRWSPDERPTSMDLLMHSFVEEDG